MLSIVLSKKGLPIQDNNVFNQNINAYKVKKVEAEQEINGVVDFNCATWVCYEYATGGGYDTPNCQKILGASCAFIAGLSKLGSAICAAGILVGCYVPKWKICIRGAWEPYCPY